MSIIISNYLDREYGLKSTENDVDFCLLFQELGIENPDTCVDILERVIEGKIFNSIEAETLLSIDNEILIGVLKGFLENKDFSTPFGNGTSLPKIIGDLFNVIIVSLIKQEKGGKQEDNGIEINGKDYIIINNHIFQKVIHYKTEKNEKIKEYIKIGGEFLYTNKEIGKQNIYLLKGGIGLLFSEDKYPEGGVDFIEGEYILNGKKLIKFINNNIINFIDLDGNLLFRGAEYLNEGFNVYGKETSHGGIQSYNGIFNFGGKDFFMFYKKIEEIEEKKSKLSGKLQQETKFNGEGQVVNIDGDLIYTSVGSNKIESNSKVNLIDSNRNLFFSKNDYPLGGVDYTDKKVAIIGGQEYIRFIDNGKEKFIDFNLCIYIKQKTHLPIKSFVGKENGTRFFLKEEKKGYQSKNKTRISLDLTKNFVLNFLQGKKNQKNIDGIDGEEYA